MSSRPLKLYFSDARQDNFTTGTSQGEWDSQAAGYWFVRNECYCLPDPEGGTRPLKLFYNDQRGDNFVTATDEGQRDAKSAGYAYVRDEGHVYADPGPGTVPLKLYWSPDREDNFCTATEQGEKDAQSAGYQLVRIEGHVRPQPVGGVQVDLPLAAHQDWQQEAMHMTVDAWLNAQGQLTAKITTWSTWWLRGFTGACLFMVVDVNDRVIYQHVQHPLSVDGTATFVPGLLLGEKYPSSRLDNVQEQVPPDAVASAYRLQVQCREAPPDLLEVFNKLLKLGTAVGAQAAAFIAIA